MDAAHTTPRICMRRDGRVPCSVLLALLFRVKNNSLSVLTQTRPYERLSHVAKSYNRPSGTRKLEKEYMTTENLTVHVPGARLQPTCRALGIAFSNHFSHWAKNSNRHYPDTRVYDGVDVSAEGAAKLEAHFAAKAAKEELKRYRAWLETHQPKEQVEALRQKKQAAQEKRVRNELCKITAEVNRRWLLDSDDVTAFAEHANEPGEGRVLRTTTTCAETFEQKVFMALVAWVRHNKTAYDEKLEAAKDAAYSEYNSMRPDFDAGERWSDSLYSRDETDAALDEARSSARQARNELHAQYTAEAVAWLGTREILSQSPGENRPLATDRVVQNTAAQPASVEGNLCAA